MCRFYVGTSTKISLLGVHRTKLNDDHPWRMTHGIEYNSVYDLGPTFQEGCPSIIEKFDLILDLLKNNHTLVHLLSSYLQKDSQHHTKLGNKLSSSGYRSILDNPHQLNNPTNATMPTRKQAAEANKAKHSSSLFGGTISSQNKAKNNKAYDDAFPPMNVTISNNKARRTSKRGKDNKGVAVDNDKTSAPPASPVNKQGSTQKKRVQPRQTPEKSPLKDPLTNAGSLKDNKAEDNGEEDLVKNLFGMSNDKVEEVSARDTKGQSKATKNKKDKKNNNKNNKNNKDKKKEDKEDVEEDVEEEEVIDLVDETEDPMEEEKATEESDELRLDKAFFEKLGATSDEEIACYDNFFFAPTEVKAKEDDPDWIKGEGGTFRLSLESEQNVKEGVINRWANRIDWTDSSFIKNKPKEVASRLRAQGFNISDEDLLESFGISDKGKHNSDGYNSPSEGDESVGTSLPQPPSKQTTGERRQKVQEEEDNLEDDEVERTTTKPSRVSFGSGDIEPPATSSTSASTNTTSKRPLKPLCCCCFYRL